MIGVVLAGGASKRMGRDKALVEVAGQPMIAWVIDALAAVCPRVLISGRDWNGWPRLDDHPHFEGPLAGLAAALDLGEDVLLVGVDQPWVRSETLASLAEHRGVPVDQGLPQVTCGSYQSSLDPRSGDGSLQSLVLPEDLIPENIWRSWDEDGRSWFSVDRPDDLATGLERFGSPQPPM